MARPERHDAEYFPFLVKDGRTLFVLESKYGCAGTGFFTNVMRILTSTPDHHICIKDESDRLYFFSKCHCDEITGEEMLLMMVKTGKLDRELFEQAGVIACQDHLDSLKDAYSKRKNKIITMDRIKSLYGISAPGNPDKGTGKEPETRINSGDNTQSKGKQRIVLKQEEKTQTGPGNPEAEKTAALPLTGKDEEQTKYPPISDIKDLDLPEVEHWIGKLNLDLFSSGIFPSVTKFMKACGTYHRKAVLHALLQCFIQHPDNPPGFCRHILEVESQNYHALDHEQLSRALTPKREEAQGVLSALGK